MSQPPLIDLSKIPHEEEPSGGNKSPKSVVLKNQGQLTNKQNNQKRVSTQSRSDFKDISKKVKRVKLAGAEDVHEQKDDKSSSGSSPADSKMLSNTTSDRKNENKESSKPEEKEKPKEKLMDSLLAQKTNTDTLQRNFWALSKGIKVKEIERAQHQLTTYGVFGQKQDVLYDDPAYKGSSDEENQQPKQEIITIPEDYERFPLSKQPKNVYERTKQKNQAIETFFMDNFNTILKQKTEADQEMEVQKANQMEQMLTKSLISLQGQISADINRKFQFDNIADEFEKGFRRNQKKIFGELNEQEQNKIKYQKLKMQLKALYDMDDTRENQLERDRVKAQMIRMRDQDKTLPQDDDDDMTNNKQAKEDDQQTSSIKGPHDNKSMNSTEAMALLDMTLSAITQVTSNKGSNNLKRLNEFERETAKMLEVNIDLLQREDLTMASIAKLKLLKKLQQELSKQEKINLWNQFMAILNGDKNATKFKIRNIALRDELGDNLYKVERALDENRDKRRREITRRNLKQGIKKKPRPSKIFDPNDPFKDIEELSQHSDESGYHSQASRFNYWEGIEAPEQPKKSDSKPMLKQLSKSSLDLTSQFSYAETIRTGYVSQVQKKSKQKGGTVHIVAIKEYENQITDLNKRITSLKENQEKEKKNIKAQAIRYCVGIYKSKAMEISRIFSDEVVGFFRKYTFLRKQLLQRDKQLTTCLKNLYDQENIITELRQFFSENRYAIAILNDHLAEKGFPKYKVEKRLSGSSEVIRQMSQNALEHFELYSSIVFGNVDGSKVQNLEIDVQIYEEQIEAQKDELQAWNDIYKIMTDDKIRLEKIIEKQNQIIDEHDAKVERIRQELLGEIQERDRYIERLKEAFSKEKKKLIYYGDIETDLNKITIEKLQEKLDEQTRLVVSLKQVLRVPRLTRQFLESFEDIQNSEQVESWERSKEMKKVMNQFADEDEFNEASLNVALQLQFENDMDLQKMKKRIADKIHNKGQSKDKNELDAGADKDQTQSQGTKNISMKDIQFNNIMDQLDKLDHQQIIKVQKKLKEVSQNSINQNEDGATVALTSRSHVIFQQTVANNGTGSFEKSTQTDDSWFRETVMTKNKNQVIQNNSHWDRHAMITTTREISVTNQDSLDFSHSDDPHGYPFRSINFNHYQHPPGTAGPPGGFGPFPPNYDRQLTHHGARNHFDVSLQKQLNENHPQPFQDILGSHYQHTSNYQHQQRQKMNFPELYDLDMGGANYGHSGLKKRSFLAVNDQSDQFRFGNLNHLPMTPHNPNSTNMGVFMSHRLQNNTQQSMRRSGGRRRHDEFSKPFSPFSPTIRKKNMHPINMSYDASVHHASLTQQTERNQNLPLLPLNSSINQSQVTQQSLNEEQIKYKQHDTNISDNYSIPNAAPDTLQPESLHLQVKGKKSGLHNPPTQRKHQQSTTNRSKRHVVSITIPETPREKALSPHVIQGPPIQPSSQTQQNTSRKTANRYQSKKAGSDLEDIPREKSRSELEPGSSITIQPAHTLTIQQPKLLDAVVANKQRGINVNTQRNTAYHKKRYAKQNFYPQNQFTQTISETSPQNQNKQILAKNGQNQPFNKDKF